MKRNTVLVVIFFLLLIINSYPQEKSNIVFDDVFSGGKYLTKTVSNFVFSADGLYYYLLEYDTNDACCINKYDCKTGQDKTEIFNSCDFEKYGFDYYDISYFEFDENEKHIMLCTDLQQDGVRTILYDVFVYDLENKSLIEIPEKKIITPQISPDGSKLAFVKDYDMFYCAIQTGSVVRITSDGKKNEILNGRPDWVHEEEFGLSVAFNWSGKSDKIAYYKFNESNVKDYTLQYYKEKYMENYTYKYPCPGDDNSNVDLFVYNINNSQNIKINIDNQYQQRYFPVIKWINKTDNLCIYRLNRLQNSLDIYSVNTTDYTNRLVYYENNNKYIEINNNIVFLDDNQHFIITSEKSGYRHLYLYNINGLLVNQITDGKWDVDALESVALSQNKIYYSSAEVSPLVRHLYSVNLDGTGKKKITQSEGFNNVKFGNKSLYFLNSYSNFETPNIFSVCNNNSDEMIILEDNRKLKELMSDCKISKCGFFQIETSESLKLNAWMIKPYDFDENKKYPVFMTIYGGPNSQTVTDRWNGRNFFWYQYLAQRGYIVVSVDCRGTGFRGEEFKKIVYCKLGFFETADLIETARYLRTLNYVDSDRVGIFGWSYGGFLSSMAVTKGAEYFKTAVAVAPVTRWEYYDNIYTERYMQTPELNPEGYAENTPIEYIDSLKGNLLIVHGLADDNVHFQNSAELISKMISRNKKYDSEIYPNKNHGIYGGKTRLHLFDRITKFVLQNL